MWPRRDFTNHSSGYATPRPTGSSVGGRLPLHLITNQKPFRSSTAQSVETESPQSETFPQDAPPPMPPRPSPFSLLPPGRSGSGRQSTQPMVIETSDPPSSSPPQLRSPNVVPMPFPLPQESSAYPPPTPIGLRPPFPSESPIGFAVASPMFYGPSHDYSHQYATGHPDRFNAMPSPRSDPGSPHYEPADISGGIHADVWPTYNRISQEFDEKKLLKWNTDLDVLLIFAALFSAIVTAFVTLALGDLQPDYQQQSALLLYQLLNGRDPNLASISDPTASFEPSGLAIAVNCLWFASLSASLGASFGAMICKEWLTEYNGGANPVVDLLRACQRQIRFMAFQRWNVHTLIALLPPLLHSSVLLFFTGAVIYLWQINVMVAIAYLIIGGIFAITYFISTFLPMVTDAPFRPYSTLLVHRLSVAIGKVIIPIIDPVVHLCFHILRYVTSAILLPIARVIFGNGPLHAWYLQTRSILPGEYKHLRVWWANAFNDSLDGIDTSQRVQDEAILWLSQMPLEPSESKAVVSSLALMSSSRPHKFPKPVTVFLNLTLDSSYRQAPGQVKNEIATDCIFVLGHIKYQSVVDRCIDEDHSVGGISVTPLVAWAAQQLTIGSFNEHFNTSHSEGDKARLLMAAAWLSPVEEAEGTMPEGEKLAIQDRWEFVKEIRKALERHVREERTLDNKALISLIHGMHACIPRGDYGSPSSVVPFLPLICEDYISPWSEDESVLRALITYALDLSVPPKRRKPLVEREIGFDKLASELIDTLMAHPTSPDVFGFGFWLIYRVPYALGSRKSTLEDIARIWALTSRGPSEDHRQRMSFGAAYAFVSVAQYHAITHRSLSKLAAHNDLDFLKAILEDEDTRSMAIYATAMILNLGSSAQVIILKSRTNGEVFRDTLHTVGSDPEKGAMDEGTVTLYIYSALALLKFHQSQLDVEKVGELIGGVEKVIGDPVVGSPGVTENPGADISAGAGPDRLRWKAIYLIGLLLKFLPRGEKERRIGGLRGRVRALVQGGGLPIVGDYGSCLEPFAIGPLPLTTPTDQRGQTYTAFETWVKGFPLFPLAGSVLVPAKDRVVNMK